jgi:hypothetical protein
MKVLIKKLRAELFSKPAPGEVLNNEMEKVLKEVASRYRHDSDSLWIGSYLADMFIQESKEIGDINKHIPMALAYANKLFDEENLPLSKQKIILEVISTHHGGTQKYIESRLYKNADCFKFLEPKGVFHIFSAFYKADEKSFKEAMEYTIFKVEEKYRLVDLDDELIKRAKELYDHWQWFFARMPYVLAVPDLYK